MLDTGRPQTFNIYDRPHADLREFIALTVIFFLVPAGWWRRG